MTSLTIYSGIDELGGNQILLEDCGTSFFLDYGVCLSTLAKFFTFPQQPKKFNALDVYFKLGIYPDIKGAYRSDYLNWIGRAEEQRRSDGFVLSHAHLDHLAGSHFLRRDTPFYMAEYTNRIVRVLQETGRAPFNDFLTFSHSFENALSSKDNENEYRWRKGDECKEPRPVHVFEPGKKFKINDVEIEPLLVDHSLPGACGFIVYTSKGPVAYTGDLRLRGRRRHDTENFIRNAREAKPLYLLCEGSLIDRKHVGTEQDVVDRTSEFIKKYSGAVFVSYPPRDLDRILSFYEIAKQTGRFLVIDSRQALLLDLFNGELGYPKTRCKKHLKIFLPRKTSGSLDVPEVPANLAKADYFIWERKYINHPNRITLKEIKENPGQFIIFLSQSSIDDLVEFDPPSGSVYIRSHPEPYSDEMELGEKTLLNWLNLYGLIYNDENFNLLDEDRDRSLKLPLVHVTGHMSFDETEWLVNEIAPEFLIPIHTVRHDLFQKMYDPKKIIALKKGVPLLF